MGFGTPHMCAYKVCALHHVAARSAWYSCSCLCHALPVSSPYTLPFNEETSSVKVHERLVQWQVTQCEVSSHCEAGLLVDDLLQSNKWQVTPVWTCPSPWLPAGTYPVDCLHRPGLPAGLIL
jgi:hypothetical protein